MADRFVRQEPRLESPSDDMVLITPNDAVDLATPIRAFVAGTAGDVKVTTYAGNVVIIPSSVVYRAAYVLGRIKKIHATGTTATEIVGFI
ncbi:MAG: hypothetical protein JKY80_02105 [Mariprofundaceae bacterium]|nr:hypothetical protein [Methylophaga sp.]MBL4759633.1 hypothetical protein [Mariprofundaceae bacterium]